MVMDVPAMRAQSGFMPLLSAVSRQVTGAAMPAVDVVLKLDARIDRARADSSVAPINAVMAPIAVKLLLVIIVVFSANTF